MSVPLWTVPLVLCALLAGMGWIGERWRSRKRTRRIRPTWDVPDGVTALDVAEVYWRSQPPSVSRALFLYGVSMRRLGEAMALMGRSAISAREAMENLRW
jgi:hypothetical protein